MLQPLLKPADVALGKQMRSNNASWREIGRTLNVDHHTAHAYIEPAYREQRTMRIVLARKARRKAHQAELLRGASHVAIVVSLAQGRLARG